MSTDIFVNVDADNIIDGTVRTRLSDDYSLE